MNITILTGHLTRDVTLKYPHESAIGETAIAVTEGYGNNKKTMFIDISLFGKTAENANKLIAKGSKVLIEGRLDFSQWVSQAGVKMSKHTLKVDKFEILDVKEQVSTQEPVQEHPQTQQ